MKKAMIMLALISAFALSSCETLRQIGLTGVMVSPVDGEVRVSVGGVDVSVSAQRLISRPQVPRPPTNQRDV